MTVGAWRRRRYPSWPRSVRGADESRLRTMVRTVRLGGAKAPQAQRVSPTGNPPAPAAASPPPPAGHSAAHPASGTNSAAASRRGPRRPRDDRDCQLRSLKRLHDGQRDQLAEPAGRNVAITTATTTKTDSLSIWPPLGAWSFYLYHGGDTAPRQIDGGPTLGRR